MRDKILLGIGVLLLLTAVIKPDLSNIVPSAINNTINTIIDNIDNESQKNVQEIVNALKNGSSDRKQDGKRLASLYNDMATLISLDGDDEIIKNTEEIRQANAIAGKLLKMDMKNKYNNLANECSKYIVSIVGDDNIPLDSELRKKSVSAFKNLAWACNEGSK